MDATTFMDLSRAVDKGEELRAQVADSRRYEELHAIMQAVREWAYGLGLEPPLAIDDEAESVSDIRRHLMSFLGQHLEIIEARRLQR